MAFITYAEIVGTRVALDGANGYSVNSTSYSVLVHYSDGTRDLVEGSAEEIKPLLPFMSSRGYFSELLPILDEFEKKLKEDITLLVQQVLVENNNPLPNGITGKRDKEAKAILEAAGFKVELSPMPPMHAGGVVMECRRKDGELMTVILKMKYDIPDVNGMQANDAANILRLAGFSPIIKRQICEHAIQDHVFNVQYEGGTLDVKLFVCDNILINESNFMHSIQDCKTVSEIYSIWHKSRLANQYSEANDIIMKEKSSEEKFGSKTIAQIDSLKNSLRSMLLR